jgi:hypothetical protein
VARKEPALNLRRAQVNTRHVGNLPTPILSLAARRSFVAGLPGSCGLQAGVLVGFGGVLHLLTFLVKKLQVIPAP